jgi:CMP-N,N'-diacetyllegionaminic acid synthase
MIVDCIIPARIGSQRIKKKNLISYKKKPLVYWSIIQSINMKLIRQTIVSSDSNKILKIASKLSKKILSDKRPKRISGNYVKTETVIKHLVKKYKLNNQNYIIILQPTSPLREKKDVENIIKIALKFKLNTLHSANIYPVKKKIIGRKNFVFLNKKILSFNNDYSYNGAIYLFKLDYFNKNNSIYEKTPNLYIMKDSHSLDIDNPSDLKKLYK